MAKAAMMSVERNLVTARAHYARYRLLDNKELFSKAQFLAFEAGHAMVDVSQAYPKIPDIPASIGDVLELVQAWTTGMLYGVAQAMQNRPMVRCGFACEAERYVDMCNELSPNPVPVFA